MPDAAGVHDEARIAINGRPLTGGQSMAVRVAVVHYLADMLADPDALGEDAHGRRMTRLYADRLKEVAEIIGAKTPARGILSAGVPDAEIVDAMLDAYHGADGWRDCPADWPQARQDAFMRASRRWMARALDVAHAHPAPACSQEKPR